MLYALVVLTTVIVFLLALASFGVYRCCVDIETFWPKHLSIARSSLERKLRIQHDGLLRVHDRRTKRCY